MRRGPKREKPRGAGHGSCTHRDLCGAQVCRYERPAWWCRRASTGLFESPWAPLWAASGDSLVGSVGVEPTSCPGKNRVQSSFATGPSHQSHPLELNQNLSVFSRARRPPTQERDTRAARVLWKHTCGLQDHHRHHLRLSESDARRAQGAPRASARSLSGRAHLSRFEICSQIQSCEIDWSRVGAASTAGAGEAGRPKTTKGRSVYPGGPSARAMSCTTCQVAGGPPQIPLSPTRPALNVRYHDSWVVGRMDAAAASHGRLCGRSFCT